MTSAPLASIGMNLLDPKNDFVFKKLLAESPDLLAALINAVRSPRPAITVVEVLNPAITPEDLQGKFIVLDVLAEDAQGRRHNVEMQTRPHPAWGSRSIYYLSRALAQQLDAGGGTSAGQVQALREEIANLRSEVEQLCSVLPVVC